LHPKPSTVYKSGLLSFCEQGERVVISILLQHQVSC